jgi:uncharacterized protein
VSQRVEVLWHSTQLASSEHCSISFVDGGVVFVGTVVLPVGDQPGQIEWTVRADAAGRTRSAQAAVTTPDGLRRLALAADEHQQWRLDGDPADHVAGALDVDFGWTPATNTLPIRRLGLEPGASTTINAAWVRFPELDLVANEQTYTRLAEDRWRYASGRFEAELEVDPATGVVRRYGTDLWRAAVYRVT